MRVLVVGGGGQLGTKIIEEGKGRFELYATYQTRKPPLDSPAIFQVDKTSREGLLAVFRKAKPDVAVDTAALHNVDYCETHKDEAWEVNVQGTRNVAEACQNQGARMIFISTDYVFDGKRGTYVEDDQPNPINYYGLSKLEAEKMVAQVCRTHVIARPSVIYSYTSSSQRASSSGKPLNFAMWLTQKLACHESVKVVTDQYSSPTLADNLAEAVLRLAESDRTGIFHTAGCTRLSRFEFALEIARKLGFDEKLVTPIETSQLKQVAKRPMDSSLNAGKVKKQLGIEMWKIEDALEWFREQFLKGAHG